MVLEGKRCRCGIAAAGRISVISCSVRPRAAAVMKFAVPWARRNSGMGTRWIIGQCAMSVTVMQVGPCQIMAHVSGLGMLPLVVRAVGASERRFR